MNTEMNTELIERCNLLIKNRDAIHAAFKWDSDIMLLAGSSFYVGLYREADPEKLKESEAVLKNKTGILSDYRGNIRMPLLCKMAAAPDPEQYFDKVHGIMDQMKRFRWIDSQYKILAAMTICDHTEPAEYADAVTRTADLYQGMKENHPWLTSGEDIPFAAMLAVSGMDTNALIGEMERCYKILTDRFHDKNAVQSLSHVLAVDPAPSDGKCSKVEQIFDLLKLRKHKYGTGYELAVLGTLGMLDLPVELIVDEIIGADDYLKKQKGFGDLIMGEKNRRMYAALMVMDTHMPPALRSHESLVDSMLAVVIAMEICMIMMMTTMCAVSSASC